MTIKDQWCSCTRLREAEMKAAKWDGIVRCGECEHAYELDESELYCKVWRDPFGDFDCPTEPDGFCNRGERRNA